MKRSTRSVLIALFCIVVIGFVPACAMFTPTATPTPEAADTATPAGQPASALDGQWIEYWGVGDNSDVTYNDVYVFTVNGSDIQITSDKSDYNFSDIVFDGSGIDVTLENNGYLIQYEMTFAPNDPTILVGTAQIPNGDTYRIIWAKLKPTPED